jgi:hypothetical protein
MGAVSSYPTDTADPADFLLGTDSGGTVKRFDVGEFGLLAQNQSWSGVQSFTGLIQTGTDMVRFENSGSSVPTGSAGLGMELYRSGLHAFNRTAGTWGAMIVGGSDLSFQIAGATKVTIDASGNATFVGTVTVPDDAYGAGWNGSLLVPTKNAVYDKIEPMQAKLNNDLTPVKYDAAGAALGAAIADYFTSSISLEASSIYEIECHAYFLKTTAGTVTWTWAFSSAPTMVSSRIENTPITGFTTTTITGAPVVAQATVEAQTTMAHAPSGSLTTAVRHSFMFWVRVRTNAATTIQLRCTESAGTVTPQPGSYMRARKVA